MSEVGLRGSVTLTTLGRLGHVTLNRAEAINALTLDMIRTVQQALDEWRVDPNVQTVLITGAGERGFCAGGDIRFVWAMAQQDRSAVRQLWREEYLLDHCIATYPKPVVTVAHGVTMGGGIGLSAHASHRVVTPDAQLAMPEVRIGLAPDVGGLWLLSRAPGQIGTHLTLTGTRTSAAGAVAVGLADYLLPRGAVGELIDQLTISHPDSVLGARDRASGAAEVDGLDRTWIDRCYAFGSVSEILAALTAEDNQDARDAALLVTKASPTAVQVSLAALRRARSLSLPGCFVQDYRLSCRFLERPDLTEGIRAQVIDRDREPRWSPNRLVDVTDDDVAQFFLPVDDEALLVDELLD